MTAAATRFDMDNDGDLDMITHPVNGPVTVFRNATQTPGVVVSLADRRGNHDGIGTVLTLTDGAGNTQMREVQLGGGFMSYDAPRVHFGQPGTRLDIAWADGAHTVIEGTFAPGLHHVIARD